MWELCMHPNYVHFIPLTSKQGKFQPQTNIFLEITTLFLLSFTVVWIDRLKFLKKNISFSSLKSCYHKLANRMKLILPLEKHFKTLNNMIIGTAGTAQFALSPLLLRGEGVEPPPKFSKRGLDRTSTFREVLLGKRRVTFFRGEGCNFHLKNKFKSEILNDKKGL